MMPRTACDALGTNEILIHSRCRASGSRYAGGIATVMSLATFMKLGRDSGVLGRRRDV